MSNGVDSNDHWGRVSRGLHWGMAVLILLNFPLGVAAENWPRTPLKIDLFILHKSVGLTVLLLVAVRILWRLTAGRPDELPMPAWQRHAARAVHVLLYVLMIGVPLSGWLLNAWADIPLKWFWLYPVPDLVVPDEALKEVGRWVHVGLVSVLFVALALHIGGALKHHFVDRDAVLIRMWRGRAER